MRVQRQGGEAAPPFVRAPLVDVSDGTPPASRFERIGGRPTVECVVDALYAHIASDARIRALFPADLNAGRAKQRLFFEQWLGGEARYSARYGSPRLRQRHLPFPIDRAAAQHWLTHMAEALSECRVDAATAAEIMADLRPLALHMVNVGPPRTESD